MLRVVADSNVYISALNFSGVPEEVLAMGRRGQINLFISRAIMTDLEGVLTLKFEWSRSRAKEALGLIRSFTTEISPLERLDVIRRDEPDNRILECAVAADARYIVTGDRHLQELGRYRDTFILAPAAFLRVANN